MTDDRGVTRVPAGMDPQDSRDRADAARTARQRAAAERDSDDTTCPHCGESSDLAKVKGCIKCLSCGFKFDCNGW